MMVTAWTLSPTSPVIIAEVLQNGITRTKCGLANCISLMHLAPIPVWHYPPTFHSDQGAQ